MCSGNLASLKSGNFAKIKEEEVLEYYAFSLHLLISRCFNIMLSLFWLVYTDKALCDLPA